MGFLGIDGRFHRLHLGVYLASRMLHPEGEGIGYRINHLVEVGLLHLEDILAFVEHRHLQYLLHEESQSLALVVDYPSEVLQHGFRLVDALVVEHL